MREGEREKVPNEINFGNPERETLDEKVVSPEEIEAENAKEAELSPEEIEKIMEKVQDINQKGITFSKIDFKWPMPVLPTGEGKLESIFKHGLIGTTIQQLDIERDTHVSTNVIHKDKFVKSIKGKNRPDVFFHILGRGKNIGLHYDPKYYFEDEETMGDVIYDKYTYDNVYIIFDISKYKEDEIDGNKPLSSYTFSLYPGKDREIYTKRNKEGKLLSLDNDYGFRLSPRVPPRYFQGVCFTILDENTKNKKDWEQASEKSPKLIAKRAESIAREMQKGSKAKLQNLVPVYDVEGNLWWPKQMSYDEVKKFVEERDKDKK
jgi:hypothetical protein